MKREAFSCVRGGLTIRGHVYRNSDGVLPAVILSHGFTANERSVRAYAKLLAGMGYAAFAYDFNGGGIICHSDGKSVDMTVFSEVEDLHAVMDYVRSRPDVDSDHVTLLGCSQGGLVSAMLAKQRPQDVEKLVLFYPALCIPDDARNGRMMFARFDPANVPPVICRFPMKLGAAYAETVMDMDVYEAIRGYEGPTLLIHGTKDKIVDISYADKAQHVFPRCTYHVVNDGTHGFRGKYDKEAQRVLADYMKR